MISEELKQFIGKTGSAVAMEVEKGDIMRYADAVDDANPLYRDEAYARRSRYGSLIAPPGFFGWPSRWGKAGPYFTALRLELDAAMARAGFRRALDGGIEYDFLLPVRAGDTLSATPRILSIDERESRSGKMMFTVIETTYVNQEGELAARARQTFIHR
ncbi:MAG: MaoC family dehydratase N-terminal domain-containing protein [Chloroflexota bacterium]